MFFDELCYFVWFIEVYRGIEGKQPPEDGCMKPKHVVEEEEEYE
jgi:hypothetical protein